MKYQNLLDRFITYVKVNTRSDENSTTTPSTQSQVDFETRGASKRLLFTKRLCYWNTSS